MNKLYPDGMTTVTLGSIQGNNELVTPPVENFDTEAMRGSMQEIFSDNLGQFVVCEFLIGTQATTRKEGILYSVARSYIVLYEELSHTFVVCDIFSIKFVTFYLPGQRPQRNIPNPNLPNIRNGSGAGNGNGTGNGTGSAGSR
ncbi:MAG: hypothetical protein HFG26_10420 [Provencibacterium sp.]|jgi:hypothetical protein|nr:hypothetical protein [Provencibacterium sp.]